MTRQSHIRIVEVGPRDGLQNEARTLPVSERIALVRALAGAGLRVIVVMPWSSEFEFVATGAPWKAATLIARRFCRRFCALV